jgi:hypothetical protein
MYNTNYSLNDWGLCMLKNIKILTTIATTGLFVSTNALAQPPAAAVLAPGFYVGGAIGYGNTHQPGFSYAILDSVTAGNIATTPSTNVSSNNLAGRIFGGYQLTPYVALEMGFTKFSNAVVTTSAFGPVIIGNSLTANGPVSAYAVDLIGKVMLPMGRQGIYIFGTLGGAYLNEKQTVTVANTFPDLSVATTSYNTTTAKILPTFGAGFAYVFYPAVTGELTWSHIQNVGVQNLTNTDFWGIALTYHYG